MARIARLRGAFAALGALGKLGLGLWLRALTELFNLPQSATIPYSQRLAVARSLSASSLAPPPYLATVVVGVGIHGPMRRLFATPASLLLTAAVQAEDEEDYARGHGYYLRAAQEVKDSPAALPTPVKAVLGVARNAEDRGEASALLENPLASLTAGDRARHLQRADVQVALSEVYSPALQITILPRMSEVVATREALLPPADQALIDARQVLAWHLWQAGRGPEAETQLRERVRALLDPGCDTQCATDEPWLRT